MFVYDANTYLQRVTENDDANKKNSIQISCPKCWKPVADSPEEIILYTGQLGCQCEGEDRIATIESFYEAFRIHGVESLIYKLVQNLTPRERSD